jgi:hypothetical protein
VASDSSITRQTISAQWNPERRDIAALIRLAGVPRSFLLFFIALWAIGILLSIGWRNDPVGRSFSFTLVLALTAVLIWATLLAPIFVPRLIWRANSAARRPTSVRIAVDGITVEQAVASSTFTWASVILAIEGKRAFVFHVSPAVLSTPILVPKRALRPEDIGPAGDLIRAHAPRYRKR